jgi:hypothetical protein
VGNGLRNIGALIWRSFDVTNLCRVFSNAVEVIIKSIKTFANTEKRNSP